MLLQAHVTLIGKDSSDYKDNTGSLKKSCLANISQKNGKIIDTVRVPEELFDILESGEAYVFDMVSSNGRNGLYLRLVDIQPDTE